LKLFIQLFYLHFRVSVKICGSA